MFDHRDYEEEEEEEEERICWYCLAS